MMIMREYVENHAINCITYSISISFSCRTLVERTSASHSLVFITCTFRDKGSNVDKGVRCGEPPEVREEDRTSAAIGKEAEVADSVTSAVQTDEQQRLETEKALSQITPHRQDRFSDGFVVSVVESKLKAYMDKHADDGLLKKYEEGHYQVRFGQIQTYRLPARVCRVSGGHCRVSSDLSFKSPGPSPDTCSDAASQGRDRGRR